MKIAGVILILLAVAAFFAIPIIPLDNSKVGVTYTKVDGTCYATGVTAERDDPAPVECSEAFLGYVPAVRLGAAALFLIPGVTLLILAGRREKHVNAEPE